MSTTRVRGKCQRAPRKELGDSGRRPADNEGVFVCCATEGPLLNAGALSSEGVVETVGDGEGELSATGRRWKLVIGIASMING